MKQFEYRVNKGYCRLCETHSGEKDIIIPAKLAGKSVQIILCDRCVTYMGNYIKAEKERDQG